MLLNAMLFLMLGGNQKEHLIGIIVFDEVLTSEVTAPAEIFGKAVRKPWFAKWHVRLIGISDKPTITTAEGLTLKVDTHLARAPSVDVLIVPGAIHLDVLFRDRNLDTYLKRHSQSAEWVASNCSGAFLLGRAGSLDGHRATTWYGGGPDLKTQFPRILVVEDQPIVIDRRRLTSNGGRVSYDAALVLLGKLAGAQHAREIFDELQSSRLRPWDQLVALIHETEETKHSSD